MKHFFVGVFIFISSISFGQTKTPVLFISNLDSKLVIDGLENPQLLKNNSPVKVNLSLGDHLIQAKGENEILTQTISCNDAKQKVVSFTFNNLKSKPTETIVSNPNNNSEKLISENTFTLGGSINANTNTNYKYYSFDANDKIKIGYKLNNKGGTLNIDVYSYTDHQIVFSKKVIWDLTDSFTIPKKGVYSFAMSNNHLMERNASLKIVRVPSNSSNPNFSTNVIIKQDTTFKQISADTYTLSSTRVSLPISIPLNAKYWVYWVGIGNEAIIKYDTYTEFYSQGKSGNDIYPTYAFGMGKLNILPTVSSRDVMDYSFADNINSQNFLAGKEYKYFMFKHGNGLSSDFSKVDLIQNNMRMLISTSQQSIGQKIKVILATFLVNKTYLIDPINE